MTVKVEVDKRRIGNSDDAGSEEECGSKPARYTVDAAFSGAVGQVIVCGGSRGDGTNCL